MQMIEKEGKGVVVVDGQPGASGSVTESTPPADDDSGGGISIYNIGGVFIVIFVGIGLAIITLIVEYWYYKYKKPAMRVDSADKKMQVKQAAAAFGDKESQFQTEYR